ncbi:hypothetical protein BDW02DRAFT_573957 [Decorospora gaudefroyi]|uniref:Uncharacterized protein n=1 Tax=Decorospora gaudefroyi TaxID=184978 RepID=A0A6A5JYN4_9PLEO|nr:hypothetical protein BDW02DRAFT_573957 [Decorospora gaudefroyi]
MQNRQSSPSPRADSPRRSMQRQRSNSFPIIDALGCSTPEAQLILAEGRAAVRKRRARPNQSLHDNAVKAVPAFNPRDHLKFLEGLAALATPQEQSDPFGLRTSHSRMPSDVTDRSTSTVVAHSQDSERTISPTLGDYSANLAQFIKSQLKSIPTYQSSDDPASPLSPRSCPDLSFPTRIPQSPSQEARRPVEAPKAIDIPPIRPPMKSQFSAWSSTDDDTDDEALPLPEFALSVNEAVSKGSNYTPSLLGYYETSQNNGSFLFSSTPLEEESDPDTAKAYKFPDQSALPGASPDHQDDDDYPSSCPSHPQLTTSSAPSYTSSSASSSSYFDCKRPTAITPHMKDRIVAAVTSPHVRSKRLTAMSPWEGGALANVHDVYVESQQRVRVDGMAFDMVRDFTVPNRLTPC